MLEILGDIIKLHNCVFLRRSACLCTLDRRRLRADINVLLLIVTATTGSPVPELLQTSQRARKVEVRVSAASASPLPVASLQARAELLAHDAIPCQFGSLSQSELGVGGLSVRLTLVNMREGGRDFEFPRPAPPLSSPFSCRSALSPSLSLWFAARDGGRERRSEKKEEWSERGGTRREVGGRSDFGHGCHGALRTGLLHSSHSR